MVGLSGAVIWRLIPRPRGVVERPRDPVASGSCLIEHHARSAEGEVGKSFFGPRVSNGEAAELYPERETGVQARHKEFGYEPGIGVDDHEVS
jgi:hypothetical protein